MLRSLLAFALLTCSLATFACCNCGTSGFFAWADDGSCAQFDDYGRFVQTAQDYACRQAERHPERESCRPSRPSWDDYGYSRPARPSRRTEFLWTSGGGCAEFAYGRVYVRTVDVDLCRSNQGSHYDWTSYGTCAEYANGSNVYVGPATSRWACY